MPFDFNFSGVICTISDGTISYKWNSPPPPLKEKKEKEKRNKTSHVYSRQFHAVRAPLFFFKILVEKEFPDQKNLESTPYFFLSWRFTTYTSASKSLRTLAVKIPACFNSEVPNLIYMQPLFHYNYYHLMKPVLCGHTLGRPGYMSGAPRERAQCGDFLTGMPTCPELNGGHQKVCPPKPQNVTLCGIRVFADELRLGSWEEIILD